MKTDDIMQIIDRATEPRLMNSFEALEFLEDLVTSLEFKIEALREETGN